VSMNSKFALDMKFPNKEIFNRAEKSTHNKDLCKICDPNMDTFQFCINILHLFLNLVLIYIYIQKLINLCKDLFTDLHVTKNRQFTWCYVENHST